MPECCVVCDYTSFNILLSANPVLDQFENIKVGVTNSTLKPPTSHSASDYQSCGVFLGRLPLNSRIRFPCESAKGRYVFVKFMLQTPSTEVEMYVEVYVQRECYVMDA